MIGYGHRDYSHQIKLCREPNISDNVGVIIARPRPTSMTESALCSRPNLAVSPMCETCNEIDKTIERYRRIQQRVIDQAFIDRAKELIAEMRADKVALHPA